MNAMRPGAALWGVSLALLAWPGWSAADVQHIEWTGVISSNWSDADNWNPPQVPDTLNEQARVGEQMVSPIVNLDISPTINELFIENTAGVLELNDRTLTTSEGVTNAGVIKAYNGTATINGGLANLSTGHIRLRGYSANLDLGGPAVVNEGQIVVNYEAAWSAILTCTGNLSLSGGGAVVLNQRASDAQLNTAPGVTLTQAAGHTIRGRGQINATLINDGQILADVPGDADALRLETNPKTNNGVMKAAAGCFLDAYGISVTQSPTGQFIADGGIVRLRSGVTINGGAIASANGGGIQVLDGNNTLVGVSLPTGTWLGLRGYGVILNLGGPAVVNEGQIVVNYEAAWSAIVTCTGNLLLSGGGAVVLNQRASDAQLNTAPGVTLTQAAGHTIRGRGQINATLINDGQILADVPGDADALRLETNPKTNNGVMKAEAGAALDFYGSTITQAPTAEIAADGAASMVRLRGGASISGGSFASRNGGALICNDGSNSLAGVVLPAGTWLGVRGYGRQLHLSGPTITNEGQIVVNYENAWESRVIVDNTLTLLGAGTVILNRSGSDAQLSTVAGATLTQAAGHTVRGFGEMNAAMINHGAVVADVVGQSLVVNPQESGVTNHGTFEARLGCTLQLNNAALFTQPGGRIVASGILNVSGAPLSLQGGRLLGAGTVNGSVQNTAAVVEPGESIGTLTVNGSYAQGASGRLELEMAGVIPGADYDRLAVGGSVTLGGELCVLPVAGYSPPPDQEFVILTASSVSGEFERQAGPARFAVTYNPTNVTIRCIAAPGDVNCDSAVDSLDVGAFVIALVNPPAFQAAYPGCDMFKADMNGDGQVDGRDIALFLSLLFGG